MSTKTAGEDATLPHIQIIGSLNIDLVTITPRVPEGGETLTATSFATHPGGKGANQAAACARASRRRPGKDTSTESTQNEIVKVSMVGAVGNDAYAQLLTSSLERNGVDCQHVSKVEDSTGVAVILVEEQSGQNRILFTPGANSVMKPDLVPSLSTSPKPDLIVMQLEIPIETVLEILRMAKSQGIDVLLNPAPAVKLPDEALNGLAHLVLNETEAGIMCDIKPPSEAEAMDPFLDQAFSSLTRRGVRFPIITLGSKGVAYAVSSADGKPSWKMISALRVPKVVDTTAAGDTFVGYYAVSLAQARKGSLAGDWDPAEAVAHANRAAAQTVTKPGAMESIPYMDELVLHY